jgi:hypothetical protein
MGRSRRATLWGTAAALALGSSLTFGLTLGIGLAGAVPAKGASDPCALLTSTDVGGLSTTWTLDKTDDLSSTNCLYSLQGDGDSTTVNLFVDKPGDFSMQKALVKKAKKVAGLSSGYSGTIPGNDVQVGFKKGSSAIRMTSQDLSAADMVLLAKAVNKHL